LVTAVATCTRDKRTEGPSFLIQCDDKLQGLCLYTNTSDHTLYSSLINLNDAR